MKPIIGIILRNGKSDSDNDIELVYTDIILSVIKSGGIPIGIFNNNFSDYLNMCDGFILQGGDLVDDENLLILDILNKKHIPVLGICLGMQEMGIYANGSLTVSNQPLHKYHSIDIATNSLLYKIIGKEKIIVNSRHKDAIFNTDLFVGAKAGNIIEAIEDNTKRFFLGLQWHPENTYDKDINSKKIFDYFIKMCHH